MLSFPGSLRIYVALEPCGMRKSFNGLYAVARKNSRKIRGAEPCSRSSTNAATGSSCSTSTAPGCGFWRNGLRPARSRGRSRVDPTRAN